jgi:hypothetical protein
LVPGNDVIPFVKRRQQDAVEVNGPDAVIGFFQADTRFPSQAFMRALVIELPLERVEVALLGRAGPAHRLNRLAFERPMHPFMGAILLSWLAIESDRSARSIPITRS